jgi:predicted dinucleotide-binding enzyme
MKITTVGAGKIGSTLAQLAVDGGHEVRISNSRGPDTLRSLAEELGDRAEAATVTDAARFGDLVVVATPLGAFDTLPAPAFEATVVVDASNYYPNRDGQIPELDSDETTSTELLAGHLAGARVVKAFNTMRSGTLATAGDPGKPVDERLALYVAGDDAEAKGAVLSLIDEFGFAPIDTGSLAEGGRKQQAGGAVYGDELTGAEARERLGG